MRIKDIVSENLNKINKQRSFCLRARHLKKYGITPEYLLNLHVPNPKSMIKIKGGNIYK